MVVCGSMISGSFAFLAVMMMIAKMRENWGEAGPVSLIALGLGLASIGLALFVPPILARSSIQRARADRGSGGFRGDGDATQRIASSAAINLFIIRFALLEGGVFFSIMSLLVEGCWISMGVAVLLLAIMLALFPFPARFEAERDRLASALRD